jgi:predicted lipoprotein with Yx(FWY)xxD motif
MKYSFLTLLASSALASTAFAQASPAKFANGLLVDSKGMTLYTFDKDVPNKSNCNDGCLKAWPALVANNEVKIAAPYSVVVRDDGVKQVALSGKPLYYYAADQKAGDVTGDKVNGVWHVVREKK